MTPPCLGVIGSTVFRPWFNGMTKKKTVKPTAVQPYSTAV
jgi:hypothetical protein